MNVKDLAEAIAPEPDEEGSILEVVKDFDANNDDVIDKNEFENFKQFVTSPQRIDAINTPAHMRNQQLADKLEKDINDLNEVMSDFERIQTLVSNDGVAQVRQRRRSSNSNSSQISKSKSKDSS